MDFLSYPLNSYIKIFVMLCIKINLLLTTLNIANNTQSPKLKNSILRRGGPYTPYTYLVSNILFVSVNSAAVSL